MEEESITWSAFTKKYAKQHGLTYGQALSQAGAAWKSYLEQAGRPAPKPSIVKPKAAHEALGDPKKVVKGKRAKKEAQVEKVEKVEKVDPYDEETTTTTIVVKKRKALEQKTPEEAKKKKPRKQASPKKSAPMLVEDQLTELIKSNPPVVSEEKAPVYSAEYAHPDANGE